MIKNYAMYSNWQYTEGCIHNIRCVLLAQILTSQIQAGLVNLTCRSSSNINDSHTHTHTHTQVLKFDLNEIDVSPFFNNTQFSDKVVILRIEHIKETENNWALKDDDQSALVGYS